MKELENDKELREVIKRIKLEKPGEKFTLNVMNRVFELATEIKPLDFKLHILGWKFWVLVSMFVALGGIIVFLSQMGIQSESTANSLLQSIDSGKVGTEYKSILGFFNKVPVSLVAILSASSLLIFLERLLSKKKLIS